MEEQKNTRYKSVLNRELIQQNGGKATYFQIIGLALIGIGIGYFTALLITNTLHLLSPQGIAIAFFIIMLGVAFAFPDLLKGQTNEISTMRIIVFMLANVICMLLLKNGWQEGNLSDIGLDGYWMGVIALLFGAKAAQKYFENAKSLIPGRKKVAVGDDLSKIEISRLAVIQNRDYLFAKYPNIESVSDTIKADKSSVTIYVNDKQTDDIPTELSATLKNGKIIQVPTEIIPDSGEATPHLGQLTDELSDTNTPNYFGSICCIVESTTNPDFKGVVTSGHVFTHGNYLDLGGVVGNAQRRDTLINGKSKARLFFQQMKYNQDLAIAELSDMSNLFENYMSFATGFYVVKDADLSPAAPNISIASRQNNSREAYILDVNVSFEIKYFDSPRYMRNIILIGSTNDRLTSKSVSKGGDSGSCVYHKETGLLIGMLLGGNKKYSFVLPLEETLNSFNFKVL